MSADVCMAALAARQYSVFSAAQASNCGLSARALRRRHQSGRFLVEQRGVYAIAGAPNSWERRVMAACLAAGDGAVASHRSAARIWQLLPDAELVEITVPRPRCPEPRRTHVHRSSDLRPSHVMVWQRLPVTNPLRTMVDLGAVVGPSEVEDALDRGVARRLFSVAAIEWMRNEVSRRGRAGAGVVGTVLDRRALGAAVNDGQLEPRMARLLRNAGLPRAIYHYVVRTPAGLDLAEVDFAYPEIRLAIEVDGFEVHGTPRAMSKDFVRQNGLVPYRWHVLRFTWEQVVSTPDKVAAQIAEALAALQVA